MKPRFELLLCIVMLGCGGAVQAPAAQAPSAVNQAAPPSAAGAATSSSAAQSAIAAALASPERTPQNSARDMYRHPAETLAFFAIEPNQKVIELWPGGGWYTEVLAPLLREHGVLSAVVPEGQNLASYREFLAAKPAQFDRVNVVTVQPPSQLNLGPDGSVDRVLTFRNIHNWLSGGFASEIYAAAFRVLAPGGVFGVVEHRAKPGTSLEESKKSGYVDQAQVIELATKAGFVLEASSEINANPKDTKDYPEGVWSLPPVLRLKDVDRDKYVAIGESDRMTLRFRKPLQ
jgi:predicted methyltransferase